MFNASLVLCGIIISAPKKEEESWIMSQRFVEDATNAFGRGVEVMKDMDRGSATVSRCRSVLNRLAKLLATTREFSRSPGIHVPAS